MEDEYGFNDLEEILEASNYFEPTDEGFEGEEGEKIEVKDDCMVYNDSVYLRDEVSLLVEELEQDISEFSRDPSVNHLREAVETDGHEFVIGD